MTPRLLQLSALLSVYLAGPLTASAQDASSIQEFISAMPARSA
jgi:hypothetical protein